MTKFGGEKKRDIRDKLGVGPTPSSDPVGAGKLVQVNHSQKKDVDLKRRQCRREGRGGAGGLRRLLVRDLAWI